jgi:hypothetical protein
MLTPAQRLAVKKFDRSWVVDTNFVGELILYTHAKDSSQVQEYVMDKKGIATHTATYPWSVRLQRELKGYEE